MGKELKIFIASSSGFVEKAKDIERIINNIDGVSACTFVNDVRPKRIRKRLS